MPRLAWRPDVFSDGLSSSEVVPSGKHVAARIGNQELLGHRDWTQQVALAIELEDRRSVLVGNEEAAAAADGGAFGIESQLEV